MKNFSQIAILFLILGMGAGAKEQLYAKYSQVELDMSQVTVQQLGDLGIAVDHAPIDQEFVKIPMSGYDLQILAENNIPHKILFSDYARFIENDNIRKAGLFKKKYTRPARVPENFKQGSMGGMLTLDEIIDELDEMKSLFPDIVSTKFEIGTTVEERPIYAIRLSNTPETDQDRPRVHFNGLTHSREPMSMMNLIYFAWHMLEEYENDPDLQTLFENLEIYIVPCVNPDGYEFNRRSNPNGGGMWRKNRRDNGDGSMGVDLNRNFSTFWGNRAGASNDPRSDAYHGPDPFSEPEAVALRDLHIDRPFYTMITYHSYRDKLIHPYGDGTFPDNRDEYEEISDVLTQANGWEYGPVPQMVGYNAMGVETDWAHEEMGEFAFGAELGSMSDGFWPPENRIESLADEALDLNIELSSTALTQVVGISQPRKRVAPGFYLDVKAGQGEMIFNYRVSDTEKNWKMTAHDIGGRLLKEYYLSASENSVVLSGSEVPSSLFIIKVEACNGQGCNTVYNKKITGFSF